MTQRFLFHNKYKQLKYKLVQGGNVPGGHYVIASAKKNYFITPMKECNSITLQYSDIVVDIGAYVGTYAIRCARFPVKKVKAYEPTPETFKILNKTKLQNLKIYNKAIVGDNRKKVKLFISKGIGVTNSIVKSRSKAGYIYISTESYKQVVQKATIIKIDIEGEEYNLPIIEEITPYLRAIIIDFHPMPGNWIQKANSIIQKIIESGFQTIIKPNFLCGWTQAGSWKRNPLIITKGYCKKLIQGQYCCSCGKEIIAKSKALCSNCFDIWSIKHRVGFEIGKEKV